MAAMSSKLTIKTALEQRHSERPIRLLQPKSSPEAPQYDQVNFPLCLAPMVGLSHVALREVVRYYTPETAIVPWPTEMLSSRRLPAENLKQTPETLISSSDRHLVPQILGNNENEIRLSINKLIHELNAQAIDINMGCPVQKALKHNYGVALMGDVNYAASVVRMAAQSSPAPVSVKLRAVEKSGSIEALSDFVNKLIEAGASWICLHPRTAEEKRRGHADWSQIKNLRKNISTPLIGNGDIQTADDVYRMLESTECDLVMAGRALAARPWMMWQVAEDFGYQIPDHLRTRPAPRTPEEEGQEYLRMLNHFIHECEKYYIESVALRKIRFFVRTTSVWIDFGQSLVSATTKGESLSIIKANLQALEAYELKMHARTELRQ